MEPAADSYPTGLNVRSSDEALSYALSADNRTRPALTVGKRAGNR